jgi:hypothetical protein
MPLFGSRTLSDRPSTGDVPFMERFDTEAMELPEAEILQLLVEAPLDTVLGLLPPALHPTLPGALSFLAIQCPESEFGPFTLSQVRVHCRAGIRGRALVLSCLTDNAVAAAGLTRRWGFPCLVGDVRLHHHHDQIDVVATSDDHRHAYALVDPEPLAPRGIVYTASLHDVRTAGADPGDGSSADVRRLLQVDPEYLLHRADRGRPVVSELRLPGSPFSMTDLRTVVSGSFVQADITLPRLRYLIDPELPAVDGTNAIDAGAANATP